MSGVELVFDKKYIKIVKVDIAKMPLRGDVGH